MVLFSYQTQAAEVRRQEAAAQAAVAARPANAGAEAVTALPAEVVEKRWEGKVFDVNPDFIGSCLLLGPGIAEGGSIKHQRDEIMKRVAVMHCVVPNYDAFESVDQEIIKNSSRLAMAQMQYVETVRTLQRACMHL